MIGLKRKNRKQKNFLEDKKIGGLEGRSLTVGSEKLKVESLLFNNSETLQSPQSDNSLPSYHPAIQPSKKDFNNHRVSPKTLRAFTLSEVLITIAVVGVISAITLPTLIKNYNKKIAVNRLKETYSLINQVVKTSEIDNGPLESWNYNLSGEDFAKKYIRPYFKVIKDCKANNNNCWAKVKYLNNKFIDNAYQPSYCYGFVINNGSSLSFCNSDKMILVYYDVNGPKGPNKRGIDNFIIIISIVQNNNSGSPRGKWNKSGVYLYGHGYDRNTILGKGHAQCNKNCSVACGDTCGALIQSDSWKIEKDYPW